MKIVDDFVKYSDLFYTYGSLLTSKQRMYLEAFFDCDNSFSEIAEAMNISRQAVFDNIKKACDKLDYYEKSLNIQANEKRYLSKLKKLKENFSYELLDEIIEDIEGS